MPRAQQRAAHGLGGGIGRRRRLPGRRPEQRRVLAERDRDAPRVGAQPDDLAARAELIEQLRAVVHAQRQHLALPDLGRERQPLEREEHLAQALDAAAALAPGAVPGQREARERRLLDRLDLAPQARDRGAPDAPQHLDVAPLAAAAARPQRAAHERALALERDELALGDRRLEAVALGQRVRVGNGPRQRAKRATSERSASGTGSRKAAGTPPGGIVPSASR